MSSISQPVRGKKSSTAGQSLMESYNRKTSRRKQPQPAKLWTVDIIDRSLEMRDGIKCPEMKRMVMFYRIRHVCICIYILIQRYMENGIRCNCKNQSLYNGRGAQLGVAQASWTYRITVDSADWIVMIRLCIEIGNGSIWIKLNWTMQQQLNE